MRILHTADWHLGQTFFEYDRKHEHTIFLDWLKDLIKQKNIDLLLITGDIFDTPNPSAESQKMYYKFLRDATDENPNLQIIITAGNHDSAARLEAPNPLLEEMNVTVRGVIKKNSEGKIDFDQLIIPLKKGGNCLAVPYLRQGDYPPAESYALGVQNMYLELYERAKDMGKPLIAMGHLHATGSEISEDDRSERVTIGGLESISPEAFPKDIDYTALGHLHRNQHIGDRQDIRYSGAPIPMSFAEKNNQQGVVFIEINNGETNIEQIKFEQAVKLLSIPQQPQPLTQVIEKIKDLPEGKITPDSPYLELKILMTEPEPSLKYQIEEALKTKAVRLARIAAVRPNTSPKDKTIITYEELKTINPMQIATEVFTKKYGGEDMPDAMKQLMLQAIHETEIAANNSK